MDQEPYLRQAFQIRNIVWIHYYMEFQGIFLTGNRENRSAEKYKYMRTLDCTPSCNVFQTPQSKNENTKRLKMVDFTDRFYLQNSMLFWKMLLFPFFSLRCLTSSAGQYVTTEILLSCNRASASDSYFCFD